MKNKAPEKFVREVLLILADIREQVLKVCKNLDEDSPVKAGYHLGALNQFISDHIHMLEPEEDCE